MGQKLATAMERRELGRRDRAQTFWMEIFGFWQTTTRCKGCARLAVIIHACNDDVYVTSQSRQLQPTSSCTQACNIMTVASGSWIRCEFAQNWFVGILSPPPTSCPNKSTREPELAMVLSKIITYSLIDFFPNRYRLQLEMLMLCLSFSIKVPFNISKGDVTKWHQWLQSE